MERNLGSSFLLFILAIGFFSCSFLPDKKLSLTDNGKSDYVIVLSEIASPSEELAAVELQDAIEKMSGCKLPIVTPEHANVSRRIFIGANLQTEKIVGDVDLASFGEEEFIIRTVGQDLVIAGGPLRGTMYGVFTFLENYLGCRWHTAQVSKIPKRKTIQIGDINDRQKPAFEYREPFFTEAFDRYWALHNKVNGSFADLPVEVGGKVGYSHFVHTFYSLVPPEKYFTSHPAYFSLIKGKRVGERAQLCLTNPEVVQIAIKEVERWIKDNPEAKIFSISQNDWEGFCECDSCRALDEREGSHSATVVAFVNAIADALGEKYPDKYFDTLAYTYTQNPPKTLRARDNVIIRLCHMAPSCDSHPLADCEHNAKYVADLQAWRQKADRIFVWHYVTNFHHYLMPFPNFNAIREDIPFYHKMGVSGIFCQGNSSGGGEMAELRSYVLAKLLWDPTVNVDEVIDDFLQGVYGKAWRPIRRYFDMMHEIARKSEMHFHLYSDPDIGYLTPEVLQKAEGYFAKAEKLVADDPATFARVRLAHLPIYYAELWFQARRQMDSDQAVDPALADKFKQIVAENHIQSHCEGAPISGFLQTLSLESRFIRTWQIIGPFDCPIGEGLRTLLPPESEIDFSKEYRGVAGVKVAWQKWPHEQVAHIDFTEAFEPDSIGVAYALCYVHSPKEFATRFGIGSNDGVRVWLNDRLIHDHPILRQATPNQDVVDVTLNEGWNKVLVKVDQAGLKWGMYFSVVDPERILRFRDKLE